MSGKGAKGKSIRGTPRGMGTIGYFGGDVGFGSHDIGADNAYPREYILEPIREIASGLNRLTKDYNLSVNPEAFNLGPTPMGNVPAEDRLPKLTVEGSSNNMADFINAILDRRAFTGSGKIGELLNTTDFNDFETFNDALAYGKAFDELQQAGYDMTALPAFNPAMKTNYNTLQQTALTSGKRAGVGQPETAANLADSLQGLANKGYRGNYVAGFR